jgi:hypothetical protein
MTTQVLKVSIKALAYEAKLTRKRGHHFLKNGRKLMGIFSKKHQKDTPRPEIPVVTISNDHRHWADESYLSYWNLHHHRVHTLRKESRIQQLAYGFIRGKKYSEIEASGCHSLPDFDDIYSCVEDHWEKGNNSLIAEFTTWVDEAEIFIDGDKRPVETLVAA